MTYFYVFFSIILQKNLLIHQFFLSLAAASINFFLISSAVLRLRLILVYFNFLSVTLSSAKRGACVSLLLSSFLSLIALDDLSRSSR
jgi:hypothetical protein